MIVRATDLNASLSGPRFFGVHVDLNSAGTQGSAECVLDHDGKLCHRLMGIAISVARSSPHLE